MTELEAQIAARNRQALEAYCVKRARRLCFEDAWAPEWRLLLNRFFQERRELSLRWLFKRRCEKRAALRKKQHHWVQSNRSYL